MLGEDIETAAEKDIGVELTCLHRIQRRARFEIFEAVAGDEDSFGRLVKPVVGAADPLQESRRTLGRAHLDDAVDIAPVDAEVEAGRRDQSTQLVVGHCRLHLAPCFDVEAAVVDADGEPPLVDLPQVLKDQFGERTGVAEDQRRVVRLDLRHHLGCCIAARMPCPGHAAFGQEDRDVRLGALVALDHCHGTDIAIRREPGAVGLRVGNRRRQRDAAKVRGDALQAGEAQGEQIATFAGRESVDFVDNDGFEAREHRQAVGVAEQQAQ